MRQDNPELLSQTLIHLLPLLGSVMRQSLTRHTLNLQPNHFMLLGMLRRGPLALGTIAERTRVSAPTVSNTVTALERRGLVTRVRDNHDRRVVHVQLTPDGLAMQQTLHDEARALLTQALHIMTPDARKALHTGLAALVEAFVATDLLPPDAPLPHNCTPHGQAVAPPPTPRDG